MTPLYFSLGTAGTTRTFGTSFLFKRLERLEPRLIDAEVSWKLSNVRRLADYALKATNKAAQETGPISSPSSAPKPKLLDQVRETIRVRHYSPKAEDSYVHWIKRFIFFHNKRHPAEMGEKEIAQFLSNLASELTRERFHAEPGAERYFVSLPRRAVKRDRLRRRYYSCEKTAQTAGGFDTTGSEVHSQCPRSFRLA